MYLKGAFVSLDEQFLQWNTVFSLDSSACASVDPWQRKLPKKLIIDS